MSVSKDPQLHTVTFPGAILERGFWLYVWRVETPKGQLLYVGRTGDNSSPFATAPYTRMGQHLGSVKTQNALKKHLVKRDLEPRHCTQFSLFCYGPIFQEVGGVDLDRESLMTAHLPIRNNVGALEKALAQDLAAAGYDVVNTVKWSHEPDQELRRAVRAKFAEHFPDLLKE